jgi:hypothetical protein
MISRHQQAEPGDVQARLCQGEQAKGIHVVDREPHNAV